VLERRPTLMPFVDDGLVELKKNAAERSLRAVCGRT